MEMPDDYPLIHLTKFLEEVVEWTNEDDYWGRENEFASSEPILQSGENAKINYFNCSLFELFLDYTNVRIPFPILTEIVNVVFDLPEDKEVNETLVQKQVRRYLQRKTSGQNSPE